MKNRILPLISLSLLLAACSKDAATDNRLMAYDQTYCADPWEEATLRYTDAQIADKVAGYLHERGIAAAGISIRAVRPGEGCNACSCRTGKVIYVTVNTVQVEQMKAIGFQ